MVAKKNKSEPAGQTPDVDMARIKAMMGPLPDEQADMETEPGKPEVKDAPTTAPTLSKPNTEVAKAAEEANASLKAMAEDLDKATLNTSSAGVLNVNREPEDGAAPVVGEGIAADDSTVTKAVDDIVANEGDAVLEAEDQQRDGDNMPLQKPKRSFKEWIKNVWSNPAARRGIIAGVSLSIIAVGVVPTSRYFILNNLSVRASVGVTVVDSSTKQPLKNATVSIGSVSAETDSKGIAKLEHLKLGGATLQISKRAFKTIEQEVTVGWGSNPQGQQQLVASGVQYNFVIIDFLSGKPIEKAEASSGDGDAVSDKNGKIVLSLDVSGKADSDEITIQVTAANYRAETIKITANNKETNSVSLVPSRKDVYVSNRSGKYDIYTIDIDGKNEKKIVSGSGIERADMSLVVQQNGDLAAYVATRENVRNSDGYLLSTLYIVDTKTGTLSKVDQSEQVELVGWSSDGRLVYVKIAAGASGANPKRYRLVTVNTKNLTETKEIASANAFNDVVMAGDKVLYAPSNALSDNPNPGLFIVNADGTASITVTNKETFNIFRTDYSTVTVNAGGTNYTYKIGAAAGSLTASSTPTTVNRLYVDGYTNNKSIWVDERDGKGVLLSYDKTTQKDVALTSQVGLKLPVFWLNDKIAIYRVNDGKQTADYAVSIDGGGAKKIQNVSDVSGLGRWYYY